MAELVDLSLVTGQCWYTTDSYVQVSHIHHSRIHWKVHTETYKQHQK